MELKNEVGLYSSWCAVYGEIVGNITTQNGSAKELGSLVALLQDFDKKLHDYENDQSREALKQLNEKITALIALFSEKNLRMHEVAAIYSKKNTMEPLTRSRNRQYAIAG